MSRLRRSYISSLGLAFMMLTSMLFSNWSASAKVAGSDAKSGKSGGEQVTSGTVVVSPANLNNWLFYNDETDQIDNSLGTFVNGPSTPLAGSGSAQISVTGTQRRNLATYQFSGIPLTSITTLKFSTYNPSAGNPGSANRSGYLQFNVDFNGSDTFQRRLVFIPSQNGTVVQNTWKEWDAINSGNALWGYSGATWPVTGGSGTTPKTWSQILADYPGVRIRVTDAFLGIRVGEPYPDGYTENIDSFKFGTSSGTTTYDFERGTTLTVDDDLVQCPGAAFRTIQSALNNALAGDTVQVCAGSYNENVNINTNNISLIGAGRGTSSTVDTIIDGGTPVNKGNLPGITITSGTTGVSIRNLRVRNFNAESGIYATAGNNNFTVDNVAASNNNSTGIANGSGIFMHGPVNFVTINNVIADSNKARGIVIWDGFKQHITLTNNTVTNNSLSGLELQDGTASGVTVTGNTISGNGDSGGSMIGLMSGAGPNLIANNNITTSGRFGMEFKLSNGTGLETGDGSIVISGNTVTRTGPATDLRDYAGLAVIRRGWVPGYNNVDIPTGVVVKNNIVTGFVQPSTSEGFGIVVESLNTKVYGNTLNGNDVGIQRQAGHLPYTPNTNVDGDQSDVADQYFGRGNSPAVCAALGTNAFSGNGVNTRDVGPVNLAPCNTGAFAHFTPASPLTVVAGTTFSLDLLINGNGHTVRGQQSYMTFSSTLLQSTVTPDLTSLGQVLQNQVCNTPTPCTFGALTVPGGSISYASGTNTGSPAVTGDFRVAQVGFSATQAGTATIHWQFSPAAPANRNSQINDASNVVVSDPLLYQDYTINIVHAVFQGHVTWQGRPAQPSPLQALPITLTLIQGANTYNFTGLNTDANGNFSVNVDSLPNGTYTWRVKGPQYLSTSGTVVLSHAALTTQEMGLQLAGDANNDNLVDVTDFVILYNSFGCASPAPCFDARADFTGDNLVDITDFTLLSGNFGQLGNRPAGGAPNTKAGGNAVLELRINGRPAKSATVHVGESFVLELWVNAQPGTNVTGQQSYLTFPATQLRLGTPIGTGLAGNKAQMTPDNSVLNTTLQNAVCNATAACVFNGLTVPAGSLAFSSGSLNANAGTGAFKVGEVKVQATSAGTSVLRWQFSPTAPNNRNTKITSSDGSIISQSVQFMDFELKVLASGR